MDNNKWKYLSFVLMGIIAIPTLSSSIAPQAYADTLSTILNKINDIYTKVITNLDAKVSTRATQTSVDNLQATGNAIKSKTDTLPTDPASNSHIDTAIAGIPAGASQSSVNDLGTQISDSFFDVFTDLDSIMTKTNNLPTDPASNSHIDTAIASIQAGGGIPCVTIDVNRDGVIDYFEISPKPNPSINLAHCDLRGAFLSGTNLESANLESANLDRANLISANLQSANLQSANLYSADLRGTNLINTNLQGAYLLGANLDGDYLNGANLESADLRSSELFGAHLDYANLNGANFDSADLTGITYTGCSGTPVGTPSAGSLPVC